MTDLFAPEIAPEVKIPDPWKVMRARHPGDILVRVINLVVGEQAFVRVPRTDKALEAGLDLHDGATRIVREASAGELTRGEHDDIVARANREWRDA